MSRLHLSRNVARHAAQTAQVMRDTVTTTLDEGIGPPAVERLLRAYRQDVAPEASAAQFADTLAQVAVYALFVARCLYRGTNPFSRAALRRLSAPHPFLRTLFDALSGPDLANEPCVAALGELVDALTLTDAGAWSGERDPMELIGSFYEAFLREYDPTLRGRRGVYLTPQPVAAYLVCSVDALLAGALGVANGLANRDPDVRLTVEDPACGTGVFLSAALAQVQGNHRPFGSPPDAPSETRDSSAVAPGVKLRGCELLPAPYLLAHLLVGIGLLDYPGPHMHLRITLGNALEALDAEAGDRDRLRVDDDRRDVGVTLPAARPDRGTDILVMIGNPPYRGHSANTGREIVDLLHGRAPDGGETESYFAVAGAPLVERNLKWLFDDYVKFMRYAQWRIERAGSGILAFVTNSGYLDGPIFRGMRRSLMHDFDELYVLDLHGDSRRREQPNTSELGDATRDENVFAIQQGVALALFVRKRVARKPGASGTAREGRVWRADLRGSRAEKLAWLADRSVADTPWQAVQPPPPLFAFVSRSHQLETVGEAWPLRAVMPEHSLGVLTKRDGLVVGFEPDAVRTRVADFADPTRSDDECAAAFALPLRDHDRWNLTQARAKLSSAIHPAAVHRYTYRPLDTRYVYYDPYLIARPNSRVMRHLNTYPENVALVVGRQGAATGSAVWDVAFVAAGLVDQNLFRRGGACVFPLYLYPDDTPCQADPRQARNVNLAPEFVAQLAAKLRMEWIGDGAGNLTTTIGPDDVLSYIYALLFAPSFRSRHADALRADFPRIPLPGDPITFRALCSLGRRLVALHLGQRSPAVLPAFVGTGNLRVVRASYLPGHVEAEAGSVAINATQRIEGVGRSVWEFTVGGYRVAQKWLLDRRGRALAGDDVRRYRQVVAVLDETRELMRRIDAVVEGQSGG